MIILYLIVNIYSYLRFLYFYLFLLDSYLGNPLINKFFKKSMFLITRTYTLIHYNFTLFAVFAVFMVIDSASLTLGYTLESWT